MGRVGSGSCSRQVVFSQQSIVFFKTVDYGLKDCGLKDCGLKNCCCHCQLLLIHFQPLFIMQRRVFKFIFKGFDEMRGIFKTTFQGNFIDVHISGFE